MQNPKTTQKSELKFVLFYNYEVKSRSLKNFKQSSFQIGHTVSFYERLILARKFMRNADFRSFTDMGSSIRGFFSDLCLQLPTRH